MKLPIEAIFSEVIKQIENAIHSYNQGNDFKGLQHYAISSGLIKFHYPELEFEHLISKDDINNSARLIKNNLPPTITIESLKADLEHVKEFYKNYSC